MVWILLALAAFAVAGAAVLCWRRLRQRGLDRWLLPYVLHVGKRRQPADGEAIHLLLCIADHYEPKSGRASPDRANSRVERWVNDYPRNLGVFRDSDGRPPRHTFFFPIDEYEEAHVEALSGLCRAGFGEVEIHLHHDGDTAATLRERLQMFKQIFAERHGLLARRKAYSANAPNSSSDDVAYGFIHGNWALCNARPDGRWCGVNDELDVLRETGCYADFTMPSAPHETQISKINAIYYAVTRPGRPRSHDAGIDVGAAPAPANSLLLLQGPLVFNWWKRKWGVVPQLENGCVQGSQPATLGRVRNWLRARVQVPARPDWYFVKLHAHGAEESSHDALLGEPMMRFHRDLAAEAQKNPRFHYHYVTAREMYNLVKAAEAGWRGTVRDALDYELTWNGCAGVCVGAYAASSANS